MKSFLGGIHEKNSIAAQLKDEMIKCDSAISFMGEKEYDKALEIFKSISHIEGVDNKIDECISLICSEKIVQAKNLMKSCNEDIQNKIEEENLFIAINTMKALTTGCGLMALFYFIPSLMMKMEMS